MTVIFQSGDSLEYYDPDQHYGYIKNGTEYQLYLHLVSVLSKHFKEREGIRCSSEQPISFFTERFIMKNSESLYCIIKEKPGDRSFPDFAVVRDSLILSIDHFKVDASEHIVKGDRDMGSPYMRMLADQEDLSSSSMTESIKNGRIEFWTCALEHNIKKAFTNHAAKTEEYKAALREYIESGPCSQVVAEDMNKPIEQWFLVEDITPTSCPDTLCKAIASLLESHFEVAGVLLVHNPMYTSAPIDPDDIMIFPNTYQ